MPACSLQHRHARTLTETVLRDPGATKRLSLIASGWQAMLTATGHGPLGKGFPRSCQCFHLSCDESVAHRVHPGVTLCSRNTGAAFCSCLPRVLEKQEPGSLPAEATLRAPQIGASVMRCQNVSQASPALGCTSSQLFHFVGSFEPWR